jgi:uncharacterized ferritin-like protein (DUF455 family)
VTLAEAALGVLRAATAEEKIAASRRAAAAWRAGDIAEIGRAEPPSRPARPPRPELRPPREMPKRRGGGSRGGRIALLHAVAHIELNAIDLAWDIVARFSGLPREFYDDWVRVGAEEAEHHALLAQRLASLGAAYGDLPAHDGLWEAAEETAHDLLARLAVVPLVLEARGLDVTPEMIQRLDRLGDAESASVLRRIYEDEIGHVAAGARWFRHFAREAGEEPEAAWRSRVARHFRGRLKPPFNERARLAAGFPAAFWAPLAT